jgi:hypothetical protein
MHEAPNTFVARLQEILCACSLTKLAPDWSDRLGSVIHASDKTDQLWIDCRREAHRERSVAGEPLRHSDAF